MSKVEEYISVIVMAVFATALNIFIFSRMLGHGAQAAKRPVSAAGIEVAATTIVDYNELEISNDPKYAAMLEKSEYITVSAEADAYAYEIFSGEEY